MYTHERHKDKNAKRKIKSDTEPAETYVRSASDPDSYMTTVNIVYSVAATVHLRHCIQICSPTYKTFN